MKRKAYAQWNGSINEGKGTNPEELIGAAHAGCFSMALSLMLGEEGFTPEEITTQAEVRIEKQEEGFAITGIALTTHCKIPQIDEQTFLDIAGTAKEGSIYTLPDNPEPLQRPVPGSTYTELV